MKHTLFKSAVTGLSALMVLASNALAGPLTTGADAPDFSLPAVGATEEVALSQYKDKVVVIEWVNFTCPFVKKHYKQGHMQALQKKYKELGVEWIAINSGPESADKGSYSAEEMEKHAKEHNVAAQHFVLDRDGKVGKAYGATTTPYFVIINKGKVVYQGAIDSIKSTDIADIEKADNYVAQALDATLAGKEVAKPITKGYGCGVKY